MKQTFFIVALLGVMIPARGRADVTPVVTSTTSVVASTAPHVTSTDTAKSPVVPPRSVPMPVVIATPTIADEGETISTPTPHAMTEAPPPGSFVTLTRARVPADVLPANVEMVYPEDARAYDAQNAADMLSHATSILFQPQGASSYPLNASIRGAPASQTLVLIDGRPMEGVALGPADLSEIPIEQIDHIEIVRGGLSALYGPNAMGGVINVISKRATYPGFPLSHVSYEDASYGRQTYRLDFGSRQGPMDYVFYGDRGWDHGFRGNADNSQYNIGGNAGLSMGRSGKLLIDASAYHNNADVPGFRCDNVLDALCLTSSTPLEPNRFNNKDERPPSTPNANQVTDTTAIRASYLVDLPADMSLAARFFDQHREVDYNDSLDILPVQGAETNRIEQTGGGELQLQMPYGMMVGGTFNHDREDFEDLLTPANSFIASEDNWALFGQENVHWNSLTVTPSVRYDKNGQFGDTVSPRVQGLWDATGGLRFSASTGRSFRAPTFDEMAPVPSSNTLANPNLLPEKAWTSDAGFELYDSSRSFKVDYFLANTEDAIQTNVLLDPANPASPLVSMNLPHARRQGAEVEIKRVVSATFRDSWNYTYLENQGTPAGFDHLVALAYSPRHSANYTATYIPSTKWTMNATARYEDKRFSGNDQTGDQMASQVIFDLRVAYQVRQAELFAGMNDVANKHYVEVPGFPLPGRTVYAGIRLRLWG